VSVSDLLDPLLDPTHKGFPHHSPPLRRSQVGAQGWNVLAGDLPLPLAVIRRDSLQHNLGWMQMARPRCRRSCSRSSSTRAPGA